MPFSRDALLTALHGIVLGGLFLLAYSGGLLGLYSLRPSWVTLTGYRGLISDGCCRRVDWSHPR
jgi:hypothetical protein